VQKIDFTVCLFISKKQCWRSKSLSC